MRVLIMTDMEGVSGIVVWDQVTGGAPMFEEGRELYTEEINAAVRGAKAAGATRVVVVDCHGAGKGWSFNSLIPNRLDPACEWVAHHGWGRYTELWEEGCDACLLIGMHARSGSPDGVLSHTISSVQYRNLWFNDNLVGETGVNAALNGHYDVPIALVTGDEAVCREANELLGEELPTVAVKKGLSRMSARQIAPVRAREKIQSAAEEALKDPFRVRPYQPSCPTTIKIEVGSPERVAEFKGRAGVEVIGPMFVESKADDWMTAWNQFWPFA
jgi:D-amino peptidase